MHSTAELLAEAGRCLDEAKTAPEVRRIWRRFFQTIPAEDLGQLLITTHSASSCAPFVRSIPDYHDALRSSLSADDVAHVWQKFHSPLGHVRLSRAIAETQTLPEFILTLPLLTAAFPYFTRREVDLASELGNHLTLGEAFGYVRGKTAVDVANIFNTAQRKNRLSRSLEEFLKHLRIWYSKDARNSELTWLLTPENVRGDGTSIPSLPTELRAELPVSIHRSDALRFVSLEFLRKRERIRRRDIADLRVAYRRTLRRHGARMYHDPWDDSAPAHLRALPATSLWQFRPSESFGKFLLLLSKAGITNIGHLAVVNPQFLRQIASVPLTKWRRLVLTQP